MGSSRQLRLQFWIRQLGEGLVYSQKELVLPAAEQGLRWHRSAEHGPGCHSGLRRWGATWYLRSSGCGGYWNCATLRNGQVSAAASSHEVQSTHGSESFFLLCDGLTGFGHSGHACEAMTPAYAPSSGASWPVLQTQRSAERVSRMLRQFRCRNADLSSAQVLMLYGRAPVT